jgi:quercetin dioxygenase-like cupin family protein
MSKYFIDPNILPGKGIAPGSEIRVAFGAKIMLSFVSIQPGAVIPLHSHPHEQGGVCLEGSFEFTIGDEMRIVKKGEGWMLPGGVAHSVRGLSTAASALDIFCPPREDYK